MDENKTERDLLSEVIEDRLGTALNASDPDEREKAFKDAMSAVDRGNERQKTNDAYSARIAHDNFEEKKLEFEASKMDFEKEKFELDQKKHELDQKKHELDQTKFEYQKNRDAVEDEKNKSARKTDLIIKIAGVAVPFATLVVKFLFDRKNMKDIANFEKDYTWTTTPGRLFSKNVFNNK